MTRDELITAWKAKIADSGDILKIRHKNMKTVIFYPMGYEESIYYKFNGYWISLQTNEIIVQEKIKIKKDDLQHWEIVKD